MNAACNRCGKDLYEHYYAERTEEETKEFILEENKRLKTKKLRKVCRLKKR